MALFGKKKNAEPAAPQPNAEDEILIEGTDDHATEIEADIEDGGGQVIDFDAIADELSDDDLVSAPSAQAAPATQDDAFASPADFESGDAGFEKEDELDFDSVFDDGSATTPAITPTTDENPFGAAPDSTPLGHTSDLSGLPDIEPVHQTPPLTHTAPLLTSDAVATAGVPATRKSSPLLPLLGAAGLLTALGVVGWMVFGGSSEPEDETVVATNPAFRAPTSDSGMPNASRRAPGTGAGEVNPGIAVDGVPIAPGVIVRTAPIGSGPRPTVPLTPALLKQLKDLWNKGAAAKRANDFAGARAAWTQMLQLRPNHPGVQSAIDKLPAA